MSFPVILLVGAAMHAWNSKSPSRWLLRRVQLLFASVLLVNLPLFALQKANDTAILLSFKDSADQNGNLESWNTKDCCAPPGWIGVKCQQGRVYRLVLQYLNVSGPIGILSSLDQLRVLNLAGNSLNGTIPNVSNWGALWLLNLSGNFFSGTIPDSISELRRLWRLDLSNNNFSGRIPTSLNNMNRLLTLHLQNNSFLGSIPILTISSLTDVSLANNHLSGSIPPLDLGNLTNFDVSGNELNGDIPPALAKFPAASFAGNAQLCGGPLPACNASQFPGSNVPAPIVPSNPSVGPGPISSSKSSSKLSTGAIIAIVVGDVIVLSIITLVFLLYYWRKYSHQSEEKPKRNEAEKEGDFSPGQRSSLQIPDSDRSKLVFFEGRLQFELEDLLRASAEMLGKGSFGTAYKAVLENGVIVAVKRLKDVNTSGKKEFEQQMELIGKLKHPNLVRLRAYYYAKEEKLLVYDYMPNGSLHNLLHGNRGPGRVPLDWTTRVQIALGAARGLAYIHQECASQKIPHGNIKSSNILLDKHGNSCISDFGLALLMNPSAAAARLVGYRAPEHSETKKISQKADVYSFGVLLLELLTGKIPGQSQQEDGIDLPRWVQSVVREEWTAEVFDLELMRYKNIEEEMVAMLQIAMVCVSQAPDQRPKMSQVVKMIEDIRGEQSPIREESAGSQSQSPISEDAATISH